MRVQPGCSGLTHRLAHRSWGLNFNGDLKSVHFLVTGVTFFFPFSHGSGSGGTRARLHSPFLLGVAHLCHLNRPSCGLDTGYEARLSKSLAIYT